MGKRRNAYRIVVGKQEGERTLGRPRQRWEDNIKINLREIGWGHMVWIHLAQNRNKWQALVNTVANFQVPLNVRKLENPTDWSLSRRAQLCGVSSSQEQNVYTEVEGLWHLACTHFSKYQSSIPHPTGLFQRCRWLCHSHRPRNTLEVVTCIKPY
jgi:hypothetical protein